MRNAALMVIDFINDIIYPRSKMTAIAQFVDQYKVMQDVNQAMRWARQQAIPIAFVKVGFNPGYVECPRESSIFSFAVEKDNLPLNARRLAGISTDMAIPPTAREANARQRLPRVAHIIPVEECIKK